MRSRVALSVIGIVLVAQAAALAAQSPVAVSPGHASKLALVEARCPTFSWSAVNGATGYELVVYRLGQEGEEAQPVLQKSFVGSVYGWTPSLDRCLERGGQHAWSVRAMGHKGASEWSAPSLFEVAAGPSASTGDAADDAAARVAARVATHDAVEPQSRPRPWSGKKGERRSIGEHRELAGASPRSQPLASLAGVAPAAPTPPPSATPSLTVDDQIHLGAGSDIFKDGSVLLWSDSSRNTGVGGRALGSNTTGASNTATGNRALRYNTEGNFNTANGDLALYRNTEGSFNTGIGNGALAVNTLGDSNTAIGNVALYNNSTGDDNTATGSQALVANTEGGRNTATGSEALSSNTTGNNNTAIGHDALSRNTEGSGNTASGIAALYFNTTGDDNTASGRGALYQNTIGFGNTASGRGALVNNEEGSNNTAVGRLALSATTGDRNTALGSEAGGNATTGSDNIFIGSGADGVAGEGNTIRIGGTTVGGNNQQQNRTFINGIRGVTVTNATSVLINSNTGQLGTVSSSRRYKEDIESMGQVSERLLALRPVTFRYKEAFADGDKPVQFGLVAEEVAAVFPELVVYNEEGEPETVKYHLLSTLLLNELQKQARIDVENERKLTELVALVEELRGGG